jgi:hypothetical protein
MEGIFLRELWLITVHFVTLDEIGECYGTVLIFLIFLPFVLQVQSRGIN